MGSLNRIKCLLLILISTPLAADPSGLRVGDFSSQTTEQVFQQWQPYGFDKVAQSTRYSHVQVQGEWVIKAVSDSAASGLTRTVDIDLEQYPVLKWRWRAQSLPNGATDDTRAGDDHALRLYVIFAAPKGGGLVSWMKRSVGLPDTHAINYIWANQMPIEQFRANPYTDQAMMLAVNSGDEQLGEWVSHTRNVKDDYKKLFGRNPPRIKAIAIMTDTDNTQSQVTGYYGDILLVRAEQSTQAP